MKNNVFYIFTCLVIYILKWKESRTSPVVISSVSTRERGVKIALLTLVNVCLVVFTLRLFDRNPKFSNMSKLSFRARALDASKPMPVYRSEEVPDLPDFAAINRAVPQMPTGMEKEEECEHHLQRAISAQQAFGHTGELVIPTPEVYTANEEDYENIYPGTYKMPRQLIHMQPFAMDQDIPDYDMDSEDEKWINQQARKMDITSIQFEEIMDRLEKSSGQQVVTLKEAKLLLKEDDDLIIAVYDYWLNKRLRLQHPLIPTVKTEKRDGSTNNNPYVAFRRRTEKMQTRKNRKNDEASYEKMLKLRRDLSRAVTLLEMVKRREKTKREHLHLTIEIFEKRHQAGDFSGQILAEVSAMKHARSNYVLQSNNQGVSKCEGSGRVVSKTKEGGTQKKRQYTKRQKKQDVQIVQSQSHHLLPAHQHRIETSDYILSDVLSSDDEVLSPPTSPSDREDENDPDGAFAFRRKKFCNYHSPLVGKLGNWPWCSPDDGGLGDKKFRYCLTSLSLPRPRCIGFARRRIGRGGRVLLDRAWTPLDDTWAELDLAHPHSPPNGVVQPANEFLSEIKNEWLHFRPEKFYSTECSDNLIEPEDDDIPDYSNFNSVQSQSSSLSGCISAPFSNDVLLSVSGESSEPIGSSRSSVFVHKDSENVIAGASEFNLENFQSHREELFELQRKQLERLKSDETGLGLSNDISVAGQHANSQQQILRRNQDGVTDHSNCFTLQPSSRFTLDSASAQFAVSAVLSTNDVSGILNSLVTSITTSVTTLGTPSYTSHNSSSVPVVLRSGLTSDCHSITSSNPKMVEMMATSSISSGRTAMFLSNGPSLDSVAVAQSKVLGNGSMQNKVKEIIPQRISSMPLDSTELMMNQGESLIEITLPDGSVTSGSVHLEPSSMGQLQLRTASATPELTSAGLEQLNQSVSKLPVQQGQQLKLLQQPSIESNCSELISSNHGDFAASKVKLEIAQSDCGYTMDVT